MSHSAKRILDKCELEGEPYQVAVLLDKPTMIIAKAWFASDFAVGLNFLLTENEVGALHVKHDNRWFRKGDSIIAISSRRTEPAFVGTELKGDWKCREYISKLLKADGTVCILMSRSYPA